MYLYLREHYQPRFRNNSLTVLRITGISIDRLRIEPYTRYLLGIFLAYIYSLLPKNKCFKLSLLKISHANSIFFKRSKGQCG